MLLSTTIIAVVGVLITKLRNFNKKMAMVDIHTNALVKFKKLAEEREAKMDQRLYEFEKQIDELDKKIDGVKDDSTKALIDYLRKNSFDRER